MIHPLDQEFDMVAEQELTEQMGIIEIPKDPTLKTIIDLALKAYKEQMEVIGLVEPKNRVRYLEACEKLLGQAKDAMYKQGQLEIAHQKMIDAQNKQKTPKNGSSVKEIEGEVVERNSMYELLSKEKKTDKK